MIGSIGCSTRRMVGLVMALGAGCALALGASPALGQTATAATSPLVFSNAAVGVASTSAQKITETFTLTGFSTVITPTATMNYGLSYKIGAITCTGVAGNQTCTVSVTFQPTYPGGRKDAIFLMNGDTRLATVLVYGIGTAPFALLQPGVVTSPNLHTSNYVYGSVSDENGTVYLVQQGGNQILQVTSAGVVSVVPITGLLSPREIGIDGAGVMYIADQKPNSAITTFDLVQGIQGTFPWPVPNDLYIQTVAVGNTGTVYEADFSNIYVFAPGSTNGTVVPISPAVTQPLYIDVDDQEDLFILGYTLNELPFGGTQKAVGTGGELFGMGIDAAETLYYEGSTPGVAEFPASNYNASEAVVDAGVSILGASVQPNGTVDVSSDLGLDVVDRSQTTVAFGNQQVGISATGQTIQLYNGGNETLTVSNVALSGSPAFSLGTATSTTCKSGKTVAPGAFCQVVLEFLSANPGNFTGSLVFTSNSLNKTTSTSTVTFSAAITGAYMVPSPTSLDFGSVTDGTTSATKTITLTNNGDGYAAEVYSPASTDPAFTVSLGTCNVNIAVGDSCQLNVTFSPAAIQSYSATGSAQVTNAGPGNAPPVSFTLAGNGVAPPAVTLSPTSIAFAPQNIGTTSAVTKVKVTNSGAGSLSITGATITGTDPSDFAVDASGCAAALAANASCNLSVTFSPAAAGSFSGSISLTDNAPDSPQTVPLTGTGASVTESGNLFFNPAPVAVAAASAQTLTATFTLTTFSSVINPTATMHYGKAYKVGKVTCTGSAGNQTCSVPVTFIPNYPGGRKDALFLMNGTTRLATQLAFGVGQSPFALIQPGVVTDPIQNNGNYLYNSVVDENGTVYVETNNTIYSVTAAGVVTPLTVAGPSGNSNLAIDGAGVIYFGAVPTNTSKIVTYDTVQGTVGLLPTPVTASYFDGVASGNEGNVYVVDNDNGNLYTLKPDGTSTVLALSDPGLFDLVVDSNENLFGSTGGNNGVYEITNAATPVQTQVNTTAGHLGIDAANTVYVERFDGLGTSGVGELPASGYANAVGVADPNTNPTGNGSVGPDGTVYVGNYNNLDKVDRSQGAISFGEQYSGTAATPQAIQIYNGGNEALSLSNISVTGEGFTIQASTTDNCSTTGTIAVGAVCNLTVAFLPTHAGVYSGTVTFTSNSLNNTTTTQTVALSGFVYGVYVSATPNPLSFGSVADGTTSAPLTVTFTNNGDLYSAGIGSFASTDPAFVITPSAAGCSNVGVGQTCTATVTFAPTGAKAYSATISYSAGSSGGGPNQNGSFTASGTGTSSAPVITETGNLFFNPAPVAIAAASAQTLTATFALTGYTSLITPTAKMNYGLAYKVGAVSCTGTAGNQTCTVPVTFIPNLPGGHRDALFLLNGTTRLATELAYGVGQSGLALVQPGTLTQSADQGAYLYTSVVADDGTVYILTQSATVLSRSTAGVFTTLPITGLNSPRSIAIDGAGILYIADQTYNGPLITYDTVLGVQGTLPYPTPNPGYIQTATVNNTGTVYMADYSNIYVFAPGAAQTTIAINPGIDQANAVAVDSANDLFIGGGSVNELTPGGTQTQVNSSFQVGPFYTDAADTLYLSGTGRGIEEFPASDYTTSVGIIDAADSAIGVSVGPDGTAYIGNYGILDEVDRSQESIDFGAQSVGTAATPQTIQIYNGGNENLTISKIALSGSSTFTTTNPTNPCTTGQVLTPGTLCNLSVGFLSQVPGSFSGSLNFTTNSLNATSNTAITLAAVINGAYMVPSPTSLDFGSIVDGSTSSTKTITLTNQGYGVAAQVYSPASTDPGFAVTLGTCNNVNVAVGDSCQLNVTFSPTAVQSYSATGSADVTNAGPGGAPPVSFTLTGKGTAATAPAASFSPTTLSFPGTTVGSTATALTTTLTNTGSGTLNISGITLTGANPTDFAETTTCGATLAATKSCTISATFTPAAVASYTASISVADNATGSPQTVALSGAGTGGVTASPTTLNLGSETEYTTNYNPSYITLTNNTSSTVTFSNFAAADVAEFNSQAYTCSDAGTLLAGSSCQLSVRLTPLSVGTITSSVTMPYTGAGGGTLVVQLTGTGTVGTPAIDLYPLPITFGQLPVMTAATPITVQVADIGTAPLTGIAVSIAGANAADYSQTNTCSGVTVDPYPGAVQSCTITVSFTPTGGGPRNATLTVTSNSGAATSSTPLQGAGVALSPQVQFSPAQLNLFAGAGTACDDAVAGGKANAATLCNVTGAAQDYLGNTYLVDKTYNVVYKVDTTGTISVFAGTPSKTGGYGGDEGPATSASLSGPTAVAADAFGDIFISDTGNAAIREVDTTGMITSFVDSNCEDEAKGTPKSRKSFAKASKGHPHDLELCENFQPEGLVVDSLGNVIFADALNNVVLSYNIVDNQSFTFVAGDAENLTGTAGYNGDNIAADGAELNGPQDVAVDTAGNIYIADTLNYRIRKVTASTGIITTVAGDGTMGNTGADGSAATSAEITPFGVSSDLAGDLFISSGSGGLVRRVDTAGNISNFAGNGTGPLGGVASTGAVANAWFARTDNNGSLLIPTGLQVLLAGPDGLLQFGSQATGTTSAALTATVESTGDANLSITSTGTTITGADAADFAVTGNNCGTSEAPGKTCALNVTFTPSATGTRTASLSVPTNVAGSPQTVLLQGTGTASTAPAASLSPTALNFPSTAVGSTATAISTTLSNTGSATLNISGITITGANPTDFAETTTCGATLAAGATCTISVTFTPAAVASYAASISVADNASGSPQTATLTGTGTAAPAPAASLSPTTLAFPNTTAGTTATAISTTLSNTGNAVLNISGITITGANPTDFAETTTCGATLAAGATCAISVTFTPATAASYAATLSVADNASGSPQTATLTGTGTAAAAPIATLTPGSLTFAGTATGTTTAAQNLTLSNTGNAALTISGITLGGTNPVDFADTTTCGASLAAGTSCTIAVTFTPASIASFTATVSVADNAAGSPQTATLSGAGIAPPDFTVTSSTPSQTVQAGGSVQYPITVTATGGDFTGAVVLTASGLPPGATASFAPASVSPDSGSAPSLLTIQTGGQAAAKARSPWAPLTTPITALAFCVPLLWWRRRSRGRLLNAGLLCMLLSVTAMFATGCGGGYYLNTSKTYTVTVTGTSGSSQHSTTVTLTIE